VYVWRARFGPSVLLVTLLVSCGGGSSDDSTEKSPPTARTTTPRSTSEDTRPITLGFDACALVPTEEATAFLAEPVDPPEPSVRLDVGVCTYIRSSGEGSIVVSASRFTDAATARAQFDANEAIVGTGQSVPGLGDGAYRTNPPRSAGTAPPGYYVLHGVLTLGFVSPVNFDPTVAEQQIRAALARIPA
jgi:hypothetical protein